MKLKSFGCSFIYGSDLSDCHGPLPGYLDASELTWPALIAKKNNLLYECHAWPGIGNFKILCDIVAQASLNDEALFIVNWTWVDRYDFINNQDQWQTILPMADCDKSQFYFRHLHSHFKDLLNSVYHINAAIDYLNHRNIPFVMFYMDYDILKPIDPVWHDPRYLENMQKKVKPSLIDFDGKNFLDWSIDHGFAISQAWHPLEDAHECAANKIAPIIDAILHKV